MPGWTCPALDDLAAILRKRVPEPELTDALIIVESLRVAHAQLRRAAGDKNPEFETEEIKRLNDRVEKLFAKKD